MELNIKLVGLLALGLTAGLGCNRPGSAYQPKPQPKVEVAATREGVNQNLLPLEEGNQWTYDLEITSLVKGRVQKAMPQEQTMRVTKVDKSPDAVRATIEITVGGKLVDRQTWLANSKGLYQTSVGLKSAPFEPIQPMVLFPVQTGKTFNWSGKGPLPGSQSGYSTQRNEIQGPQEVDTENGRVGALTIANSGDFTTARGKGKMQGTVWIAPGIGMVRTYLDVSQAGEAGHVMLKLKSHSLKSS